MSRNYLLLSALNQNGFISYNRQIAKTVGVNAAVLFGELLSLYEMHEYEQFAIEQEKIADYTGLTRHQIQKATEDLIAFGLLIVERKGRPCRNYYTIQTDVLEELFIHGKTENKKETKNEIEEVEQIYIRNYEKLYNAGVLRYEKPIINWGQSRKLLKDCIKKYGKEAIKEALEKSMNNTFCISKGYSLPMILSASVLSELLNAPEIMPENVQELAEKKEKEKIIASHPDYCPDCKEKLVDSSGGKRATYMCLNCRREWMLYKGRWIE